MNAIPQNQSTRVISVRVATSEYIALLTEAESKKLCLSDLILMRIYGNSPSNQPVPAAGKTERKTRPVKAKSAPKVTEPKVEPQAKAKPKARAAKVQGKRKTKVGTPKKGRQTKVLLKAIALKQ